MLKSHCQRWWKNPKVFTKQLKSTEVRKWRLWESCQPGTGSSKLQAGEVFPTDTLPLIAALSNCSFLTFNNQTNRSLWLYIFSSLSLSLPICDDKESSGAAVLAKPQSKRSSGPLVGSNRSGCALNSRVMLLCAVAGQWWWAEIAGVYGMCVVVTVTDSWHTWAELSLWRGLWLCTFSYRLNVNSLCKCILFIGHFHLLDIFFGW